MKKTTLNIRLSTKSIDDAIKYLNQYKIDLNKKALKLQELIAERLREEIDAGFKSSSVDDKLTGGARRPNVKVSVQTNGNVSIVAADGEDAVWVEFGAGVYHNGPAGSSPNPNGKENGFYIGSYGKGNGQKEVWGYYDGQNLVLTHGTEATMPMYRAMRNISKDIKSLVAEVFG